MPWTCEQIEQRMADYLDRLLPPEEREAFAAHAASCARCGPLVERTNRVVGALHRLEPLEAPPRLVHSILEQTTGRETKQGWRAKLPAWLVPVFTPRFAMGAVTTMIAFLLLSQALGISWSEVRLADLHPKNLYRAADRRVNLLYARGVKFVNDLRVIQELQSRLQAPAPPESTEPQNPSPGNNQSDQPGERRQNHADEILVNPMLLAYFRFPPPNLAGLPPGRIQP